jgi:hypothetical protein
VGQGGVLKFRALRRASRTKLSHWSARGCRHRPPLNKPLARGKGGAREGGGLQVSGRTPKSSVVSALWRATTLEATRFLLGPAVAGGSVWQTCGPLAIISEPTSRTASPSPSSDLRRRRKIEACTQGPMPQPHGGLDGATFQRHGEVYLQRCVSTRRCLNPDNFDDLGSPGDKSVVKVLTPASEARFQSS